MTGIHQVVMAMDAELSKAEAVEPYVSLAVDVRFREIREVDMGEPMGIRAINWWRNVGLASTTQDGV